MHDLDLLSCKRGVIWGHKVEVRIDAHAPAHLFHEPIEPTLGIALGEEDGPESQQIQEEYQEVSHAQDEQMWDE